MSNAKILIVEDDINWLKIFQILVGDSTSDLFEYIHVANLSAALSAIEKNDFSLILLDLMLPDSFAVKTIETMSKRVCHIPIVIITTLDDEKLIETAFKYDIQDYIVKDQYDIKVFLHVCRRAIQRFIAKWSSVEIDLGKVIANLNSVDEKLKDMLSDDGYTHDTSEQ